MTLATYHNKVLPTTSSAVFFKHSLQLASRPNMSVHVWACTGWIGL